MIICPKCGEQNLDQAVFCGVCGGPISQPAAPATPSATPANPPVSDGLKIGIAIATVFVPLLGIIMGAIYMNDPNPNKKKVGKLWLIIGIGIIVLCCLIGVIVQMSQSQNY